MASICNKASGHRQIRLNPGEYSMTITDRAKIGLGKVTMEQAIAIKVHIEAICLANRAAQPIPAQTLEWTNRISPKLRDKLQKIGLLKNRWIQAIDIIQKHKNPPTNEESLFLSQLQDMVFRAIHVMDEDGESLRTVEQMIATRLATVRRFNKNTDSEATGDAPELNVVQSPHIQQDQSPPALIKIGDIATSLNVSARTVTRLVKNGEIPPPVKLGHLNRWHRSVLDIIATSGLEPKHA